MHDKGMEQLLHPFVVHPCLAQTRTNAPDDQHVYRAAVSLWLVLAIGTHTGDDIRQDR